MDIEIKIAEDQMSAHISVRADKEKSAPKLTEEELFTAINDNGVNTGIDSNAVKQIILYKIFNKTVCFANGIPPEVGENARVEILKKPKKKKDITAPQTSDGVIDYYSPREGFLVYARKGDVMAVKYPLTIGKPGKNVSGKTVPGLPGKDIALELFRGKNTVIVDDKIIAEAEGIVELAGLKINVLSEYNIEDDVGINTGSIDLPLDLNCKLVIKGDIQSGYRVSCSVLYVHGCVEDAAVTVKNLTVKEGIVGVGDQKVVADNIIVGYINGTKEIFSKTIVVSKEISNGAKIYSDVVKAYTIQGSTVVAIKAIWTDYVNGNNSITIGVDYQVKFQHDKVNKQISAMDDPLEELKNLNSLNIKRMKKLAELTRVNPKHPMLQKELPRIQKAKKEFDDFIKIRMELIKEKEELASKIYSKNEPFLLVRFQFGKDSSVESIVDPNTTINLREKSQKIMDITPGGLFTIGPHGITYTQKYNIKEIKRKFDNYFEASEKL